MNTTQTLEKLRSLRLSGMASAYQNTLEGKQTLTSDELLTYLVESEWNDRHTRKVNRHLRAAKFRYPASIEEVDYFSPRNLDKNLFLRLSDCSFIQRKENLLITGPTGTGKSFITSALGNQACMLNYRTGYFNTSKLFARLHSAHADNSFIREINRIERLELLILDDFGLQPLDTKTCQYLLEIIEDRHGRRSTILASQLPVSAWYDLFQEKTLADAILDRIIHNAHRIEMKGESLRKKNKK